MEAEIVWTGLCGFNNVRGTNPTMGVPSVIVVRTDLPGTAPKDIHIPYIAFNSRTTVVDQPNLFEPVPMGGPFMHMKLDGVELEIESDPASGDPALGPTVDQTYDKVLKKDQYWPAAAGLWNPLYVPQGNARPDKSVVAAFLRFGRGTIFGGRISPVQWSFAIPGQPAHVDNFAEEVIYRNFPIVGQEVVIRLSDLTTGMPVETLRFSPQPGVQKITIFIGNNDPDDIDNAVLQSVPSVVLDSDHMKFLNLVAHPGVLAGGTGPIPTLIHPPAPPPDAVGGVSTGPCGPASTNG